MRQQIKLCFRLVLLASAIQGGANEALKTKLFQMADNNESIHGKFKPLKNGLVGEGGFGVVFKGNMLSQNAKIVAMKFTKMNELAEAKREYEMYTYLNAVDNPKIERFGIPNVYYFNEWNGHMITVLSYFDDGDLKLSFDKGYFKEAVGDQYVNSLILFREFVRQSKYIHSRGIRHDDIKPRNIMLRNHRSFLIDFGVSSKINEYGVGISFRFASNKVFRNETRTALSDWESFLKTIFYLNQLRPDNNIKNPSLKRICREFRKEILKSGSSFPDYDGMYDTITTEINNIGKPWFTWLTPNQIAEAQQELTNNPLPDIKKDIPDPSEIKEFVYPKVRYEYFKKNTLRRKFFTCTKKNFSFERN